MSEKRECEERSSALLGLNEEVQYSPYMPGVSHCHPYMKIGVCISGEGFLKMDGRMEGFSKGSLTIIPAALHHLRQNMGEEANVWRYIAVDLERLLNECPSYCRNAISRAANEIWNKGVCLNPEEAEKLKAAAVMEEMFETKNSGGRDMMPELEAELLLLLIRLTKVKSAQQPAEQECASDCPQIEAAIRYVSAHYAEEIQVEQMAKSCAMSESHFRRLFTQFAGCSPIEYVNRYRVCLAGEMLRLSREPIQNIACRTGFSSIATFNRNFKRYTGQRPSQWRKQDLQKES